MYEVNHSNYRPVVKEALEQAQKLLSKRFTLLLPQDVVELLDKHHCETGETHSDYIRNLIRQTRK
jgi:hypothetical protein